MQYDNNLVFDKENNNVVLVKYRKLVDHYIFKSQILDYISSKFNCNFDHNWINSIFYYTNKNKLLIYFKKYHVIELNIDIISSYNNIVEKVINAVILTIKNKNIKLYINYIFDILKLNYSNINKENFHLLNKSQIEFEIYNNNIKFYIKYHEFEKCLIDNVYNKINTTLYSKYKSIELTKTKIAFVTQEYILFNNKEYIRALVYNFFLKGYWVDFISQSSYIKGEINLEFNTTLSIFLYYDIFIFQGSTLNNILSYKINFLKNKLIIHIPTNYSYDLNQSINNENKLKFIYFGLRNLDTEKMNLISYWNAFAFTNNNPLKKYYKKKKYLSFFTTFNIDNLKLNYSLNNTLLNKYDFFKIYNLDPKKKIVTIFIEWPQTHLYMTYHNKSNYHNHQKIIGGMETIIFCEKNQNKFSQFIKYFENSDCNVIFKIHPTDNLYIINNKLHLLNHEIDKDSLEIKYKKNNRVLDYYHTKEDYGIKPLIKRYTFVDNSFTNEVNKHTDYGIVFSPTTVGWYNYIHNFPIMAISSKKYDWFPYMNYSEMFSKLRNGYIKENNLDINESKLPCIGDLYYGKQIFWEDIIENNDLIRNFLNTDFKINYKYFDEHPMYGNTYNSTQTCISNKIIDIISKSNFKDTSTKCNLFLNELYMVVYCKDYINVSLYDKEIIVSIIKLPLKENNKLLSYGVNFEVGYFKNNCLLTLEFECKIDSPESFPIFPRIYTGNEWITLKSKLSNIYKTYKLQAVFDFKNNSRWRISTTSSMKNQKIFIKNIVFI
jgi:hypothetical protein